MEKKKPLETLSFKGNVLPEQKRYFRHWILSGFEPSSISQTNHLSFYIVLLTTLTFVIMLLSFSPSYPCDDSC